jgi:glycine cleavage system aminomethyltransferase T
MRSAIRRSPAARLSALRGAVFVEEAGWEIPASYGDDAAERAAIRDRVAIADVTARAKVDVRGRLPQAFPLPAATLVARISTEWAMVFGGPDAETRLLGAIEPVAGPGAMVTDVTHLFAGFALAGPELLAVLERTTSWDPTTLAPGEATGAPIAEVRALMVRRDLDVPVLEVYVATEFARYVWETLSGVVTGLGGAPVGWQALRVEGWS